MGKKHCLRVRLILVLVGGRQTAIVIARYDSMIPGTYNIGLPPKKKKNRTPSTRTGSDTRTARHTHSNVLVTTAGSETEGVAAVSWTESLMIRRPFGSIDPNSIRQTELHTESRLRQPRGEGVPTQHAA